MISQVDSVKAYQAANRGPSGPGAPIGVSSSPPQFSGSLSQIGNRVMQSSSGKLIPIFQAITELFIAAFLAQDLVAMVLPRIQKSLARGREEYDPSKDPKAQDLPFTQQMRKWLTGNVKGLNWGNASEETKRELATGPGMLVIPAIAFAVARRMMGKTAVELSHGSLNTMSKGFMEHLEKAGLASATELTPDVYRKELASYLSKSFCDPKLAETTIGKGSQTYRQYLDDWSKRWVNGLFDSDNAKAKKEILTSLGDELKEKLTGFNRVARLGEDTLGKATSGQYELEVNGVKKLVERPLHRSDFAWMSFGKKPEHKALGGLVEELRRWSDYAETVWKEKALNQANASKTLKEVAQGTLKSLVNKKMLLGVSLTALCGVYLVKVAKWAMSHGTYQANRKLQVGALQAPGAPMAGVAPQPAGLLQALPQPQTFPMPPQMQPPANGGPLA